MSMPTVRRRRRSEATFSSWPLSSCRWWGCGACVSCWSGLDADLEGVHLHGHPVRGAPLEVHPVDLRILVLVLDLVPALAHVLVDALVVQVLRQLPLVAAPADREVASGLVARDEVLVPPEPRWHEQRSDLPVDLGHLVGAIRPHERI